jgi:hypothetical protein
MDPSKWRIVPPAPTAHPCELSRRKREFNWEEVGLG